MQINTEKGDSLQRRICRLVYVLFLAVLVINPIVDANTDILGITSYVLNDINVLDLNDIVAIENFDDKKYKSFHALKSSKRASKTYQAILRQVSIKDEPKCHIIKIQYSANGIKSSQIFPSLFSDPSPPVV